MAVRRMIHRDIVCSDEFISMSYAAQALFLQFTIEADEFGFVAGAKRIMRAINVDDSILSELIAAVFVYRFNSGVVLMRDWDRANTRKNDRQHKVAFPHEYAMLEKDENGRYVLKDSAGIQWNPTESENSPAQQSIAQNSLAQQKFTSPAATASRPNFNTLEAYVSNTLSVLTAGNMEELESFKQDLPEDVIRHAVDEASANKVKKWSYVRAILNRYLDDGLKTLDDVKNNEQQREGERNGRQNDLIGGASTTDAWETLDPERKRLFEQAFAEGN